MLNSSEFDRFDERGAKLFTKFPGESDFRTFSLFHFSAGKFPFQRRRIAPAALADQNAAVGTLDNGGDDSSHERLRVVALHRAKSLASSFAPCVRMGAGVLRSSSRTTKTWRLRIAATFRHFSSE